VRSGPGAARTPVTLVFGAARRLSVLSPSGEITPSTAIYLSLQTMEPQETPVSSSCYQMQPGSARSSVASSSCSREQQRQRQVQLPTCPREAFPGGWVDYEAHEVTKKGGKLRCLLLRRKKNFLYIFMMRLLG
jgi:hypothetical protein